MNRRRLGNSPLTVTDICMGTMTFGTQCDEKLSFEIMDRAYEAGIDFYDAAEMYPVPPTAALFGRTEEIVGRSLAEDEASRISDRRHQDYGPRSRLVRAAGSARPFGTRPTADHARR